MIRVDFSVARLSCMRADTVLRSIQCMLVGLCEHRYTCSRDHCCMIWSAI